jgi:hypothetical protein
MIDPKTILYIQEEMKKGISREQIKESLMTIGGWTSQDVDEHFYQIDNARTKSVTADSKFPHNLPSLGLRILKIIVISFIVLVMIGIGLCFVSFSRLS